jgi:hypothetical protein
MEDGLTTLTYAETTGFAIPPDGDFPVAGDDPCGDYDGSLFRLEDFTLTAMMNRPGDVAPAQMRISHRDQTAKMDYDGDKTFSISLGRFSFDEEDFGDRNIKKNTLKPCDSQARDGRDPGVRTLCV